MSKRNTNNKKFLEKIGASGLILIITAIITVVASTLGAFFPKDGIVYLICDKTFYISLSALLVEILWTVSTIKNTTEELKDNTSFAESVIFPDEDSKMKQYLEHAMKSPKAKKMLIICYGTSKFGDTINTIIHSYQHIDLDVIVCSPELTILNHKADKPRLKGVIEEISQAPNVNVYMSKIPPTVRSCIVLSDNNYDYRDAIFAMMQPYYLYNDISKVSKENLEIDKNTTVAKTTLFRGKGLTPIFLAGTKESPIMSDLAKIIMDECERLKSASTMYLKT